MPVVHGSVATLALGLAAMAVLFATVLAWVPVLLHPLHLRVKGGLLRRAQGGIEGLDGIAAPVGFGCTLQAQGAHAVNALGRGQLLHAVAPQARMALAGLQGGGEIGPGGFLCRGQLQLRLEGGHALGAALLPAFPALFAGLLLLLLLLHLLLAGRGTRVQRAGGLGLGLGRGGEGCGCGRRWLLRLHRQAAQRRQRGGGGRGQGGKGCQTGAGSRDRKAGQRSHGRVLSKGRDKGAGTTSQHLKASVRRFCNAKMRVA